MPTVNLFNPFSKKFPQYENRLTWALLSALNYDLLLQSLFLDLVEARFPRELRYGKSLWESALLETQTKYITETSQIVSVLLTDKISEGIGEVDVRWADRDAIYDGVITYPNGLTVILENKLSHGDVWQGQLSPSKESYSGDVDDVALHGTAICMEWSEVLEGILRYSESDAAAYSNRKMCRDFLSFVEQLHPELTPYSSFSLCDSNKQALGRRTIALLDELADRTGLESHGDEYLYRPGKIAERVALWVDRDSVSKITIGLWPADTVSQARRFFRNVNAAKFLNLAEWKVEPNLHFSYIGTHLKWADTTLSKNQYLKYFAQGGTFGKRTIQELEVLAMNWEELGLISAANRGELEYQFNSTSRETLNVIPGFGLYRSLDVKELIDLEEKGKLEAHLMKVIDEPLNTWNEALVV